MKNYPTAVYFKSTASFLKSYALIVSILLTGMSFHWPLENSQHPAKHSRQCLPEAWGIDTIPPESQIEATPRAVEQKQESEGVICAIDPKPEFEGGETALLKYVAESIRYPANALENKIEGKVIVQFLIDEQGKVSEATVRRSIGGGCDEEALRIINTTSGKWKPATRRGVPIKTWFTLPVSFKLETASGARALSPDSSIEQEPADKIYRVVEQMPEFEGGPAALLKYMAENVKYLPVNKDIDFPGKIIARFVIDENGQVVDATMLYSVNKDFDQEFLHIIKNTSGKWKPGKQRGRPVKVLYTLPMTVCRQ